MCVKAQPGLMRHKEMPAPTRAQNKTHPTKVRCAVYIQAQPGGAGDRGRTGTVSLPLDFESSTSANSITPAELLTARFIIQYEKRKIKIKMKKL